jgi:hypothetical protein
MFSGESNFENSDVSSNVLYFPLENYSRKGGEGGEESIVPGENSVSESAAGIEAIVSVVKGACSDNCKGKDRANCRIL